LGVGVGAAWAAAAWLGAGVSSADVLRPDISQPANGVGVAERVVTPPFSPIQVPAPVVTRSGESISVTAHPYLSRAVHQAIVAPPGTAIEVRGAVRADLRAVGGPIVTLFGHCLFDDARGTTTHHAVSPPPLRGNTAPLSFVIEPVVHRH
jgi:hypothetical protein